MIDKKEVFERFLLEFLYVNKLKPAEPVPADYPYLRFMKKSKYIFNSQLCSYSVAQEQFIVTSDREYIEQLILDSIFMPQVKVFLGVKKGRFLDEETFIELRKNFFPTFLSIPLSPDCDFSLPSFDYNNEELSIYNYYQKTFHENIKEIILRVISKTLEVGSDITPILYNRIQEDIPFLQRPHGLLEEHNSKFFLQPDKYKLQSALEYNIFSNIDMVDCNIDDLYFYKLYCTYTSILED